MKNLLFLFIFLVSILTNINGQRKTLWLEGLGGTSPSWYNTINTLKASSYKLTNIPTVTFYEPHIDGIVTSANRLNQLLINGNHTNVLGIGHDGGGLVLRQMANNTSRLSALILTGVPNQGSAAIMKMLPQNGRIQAQDLINKVLAFKSNANGCNACRIVETFQSWVNDINAFPNTYREYTPNHPVLNNLGTPNIPFAILRGNANKDDFTLSRTLSSKANAVLFGGDEDYLECYKTEIFQRRQAINDAQVDQVTNSVLSFATNLGTFIASAFGSSGASASSIVSAVNSLTTSVLNGVRAVRNAHTALAEVLECEMVHQGLNGSWNLMVAPDFDLVYQTIPGFPQVCCSECYNEPDQQVQGYCWSVCSNGEGIGNGFCETTYTVGFYRYKPHDGLISASEQALSGATQTYDIIQTNHFQESFYQVGLNTSQVLNDLFNGNAGAAFIIPK